VPAQAQEFRIVLRWRTGFGGKETSRAGCCRSNLRRKSPCAVLPPGTPPRTARGLRTHLALTTQESRRNHAQMTRFDRAINKICVGAAQGHTDTETLARRDAETRRTASVEATPLVKLLSLHAKGSQTLCKERSIMRQNVSKDDCLQYWCVSHNIIGIGNLPQSQVPDTNSVSLRCQLSLCPLWLAVRGRHSYCKASMGSSLPAFQAG